MKIMHVCKKYPDALGGDAVVVSNLEKQQKLNGHHVVILTSNCDEIIEKNNIYKIGLKDSSIMLDKISFKRIISLLILLFKSYGIIKREKPDIIHTHSIDMAFVVSFAARHYKIPIVHTFHSVTFYKHKDNFIRSIIELRLAQIANPSYYTAPNSYDVKKLANKSIVPITVLPNGINLDFWKNNKSKLDNPVFKFIYVGRLEVEKGPQYIIKAAENLVKNGTTNFKVTFIGEGSLKKDLIKLVKSSNLEKYTDFIGKKNPKQVRDLYSISDAIIIPSLHETTPLTLLEGWAMNLAVITTRTGILIEEYNPKSVILIKKKNASSLSVAMRELLGNPSKKIKLIKVGSAEVKKYSWEKIVSLTNDIYINTLQSNTNEPHGAKLDE
jgi:glycosyltransferase involved in cell wall biosynthesis